ncbi:MAG: hypothetical protein PVSMB1_05740 [Gemmatimonadaceae bacterium]
MRLHTAALAAAIVTGSAASVAAQDHVRLMINAGLQTGTATLKNAQTFQQYQEEASLTEERTVPGRGFYDGGVAVRLVSGLHVGASFSFFKDNGAGTITAKVPHPLYFNQLRATAGTAPATRKETGVHIQAGWTARAADGIEFTVFGGPTIFQTEQALATKLNLTLASEVYPYDSIQTFPVVTTLTIKGNVTGYNLGADMTWKLAKHLGLGVLIRYSHGTKNVTPPGGQAVTIEPGGLHAGGGLRVIY